MSPGAAHVCVENLSFTYPPRRRSEPRHALGEVSIEVARGEIFGLLGPNGGGKTTLFKILSTLLPVQSGRVRMSGLDLCADQDRARRLLGVAFQFPSLDRKLTARENMRHQGHLYGLRGAELRARIEAMLGQVGLAGRADEMLETFSGGMARRVELAKALLHRPEILVLDEPSTGLDPGARQGLWDHLLELRQKDGVTVLLTTHLMDEAARCDRLALLDAGRIVALGTPAALTGEVGGDVVTIQCDAADQLLPEVESRFGRAALLDGSIRIESVGGHQLIPRIVEAFPGRIQSIALGKPTLEDVFIRRTGHRFFEAGS